MQFIIETESDNSIFKQNGFPELIRCKDCEYRNNPIACRMESEGMHTTDDWFCADGIRRGSKNETN